MAAQFRDARLKVKRANEHLLDIQKRIIALNEKGDTGIVEIHPQHGTERLTHSFSIDVLNDFGLVIGDAVHNLKCALDYTWLKTIERFAPFLVDGRAKFPVRKSIKEVEGFLTQAHIDTACRPLFRLMLDTIKPCDGGNDAIWSIHNFDNRDKHRLLIPVLAAGYIDGIEVQDEMGERWPGFGTGEFQRPPYCIDFTKGLHVTKKGKLTAQIGVEDEKSGCFMRIPDTLSLYSGVILRAVELFEGFVETGT